jgi:hypothetical protein
LLNVVNQREKTLKPILLVICFSNEILHQRHLLIGNFFNQFHCMNRRVVVIQSAFFADCEVASDAEELQWLGSMLQAVTLLFVERCFKRRQVFNSMSIKTVHVRVRMSATLTQILGTVNTECDPSFATFASTTNWRLGLKK